MLEGDTKYFKNMGVCKWFWKCKTFHPVASHR